MKLKKTSLFLALGASLFLTACSGDGPINSKLSEKDAKTEVEAYYKKIDPKIAELKKDISNTSLQENEELPDIDATYPYTVKGSGEINAEIFVSSEKAGSGKDGILNEIAESFNNQHQTIDGKTVSVSIRSIPSGTSVDYIASKTMELYPKRTWNSYHSDFRTVIR